MNLSLPAIFGAGVLTFASPCVLPLIPVYLSVLAGASVREVRAGGGRGRLLATSAAFALGLALTFVAMGMAATAAGRALATHRVLLAQVGGVAVILFGMKLLGVLRLPWLEREYRPGVDAVSRRGGMLGAFLFGAAFGVGWTPCIGPVLGAVLTYTASAASNPWVGGGYLAVYAAGLALPLVATAAVAPVALAWLRRAQAHVRKFEVATGLALTLTGALLVTDRVGALGSLLSPAAPAAARAAPASAPCDAADGGAVTCGVAAGPVAPGGSATLPPRPVLVEFVSSSCTVCRRMAPVVRSAEHQCQGSGVALHPVDVGTAGGRALARRYGVLGVPTFVTVDERGRAQGRLIGERPREEIVGAIEALAGGRCDVPAG